MNCSIVAAGTGIAATAFTTAVVFTECFAMEGCGSCELHGPSEDAPDKSCSLHCKSHASASAVAPVSTTTKRLATSFAIPA